MQIKAKVSAKPSSGSHIGHEYVTFVRASTEQLRQIVSDEIYVSTLFEVIFSLMSEFSPSFCWNAIIFQHWYEGQVKLINSWLSERLELKLSSYQLTCLSFIIKVIQTQSMIV